MTLKHIAKKLSGYDSKEIKTLTDGRAVLILRHDYEGPYPTRQALNLYQTAAAYARKHGYTAEQRGHYTATFIY